MHFLWLIIYNNSYQKYFSKFQLMLKLEKKSKKSLTLEESHLHQVSFYDIYLKNLMDKSYMHTE